MRKKAVSFFVSVAVAIAGLLCMRAGLVAEPCITVYGNVDVRQVDLGFRVFGRVEGLLVEEGDWVEAGTRIATMEKEPYTDQVTEIEARVASIKASLANEEKKLLRRNELISSKGVSQEDLDTVHFQCLALRANLEEATAALAVAQKNLADTELFAPTSGTILTRVREPGSIVNQGEPVYTLSIASPVWVRAFINERELGAVYPGMPADIITDTPGGSAYSGTVGFISPVSEFTPKTVETTQLRSDLVYRIRVYAKNPDRRLRQGMPVTVKLRTGPPK